MAASRKSLATFIFCLAIKVLKRINEKQTNARIRKKEPQDYVTFSHPISFTPLSRIQINLHIQNTQTGTSYSFTTYNIFVQQK